MPRTCLLVTLLSLVVSIGLFLFCSGFLLTRLELDALNSCPEHCWHPRRFNKTLLVIIDALRFDFIDYQSSLENVPSYINKLPVLHNVSKEHGLVFCARADPPTTTLQRLKAITTGNLPTFVDAGSNFASSQILEDNLIAAFARSGQRSVFMGDDTWAGLFPNLFNQSFPFPSFDVWDLHSVDDGVLTHLYPLLQTRDWDVAVAHFLGVDHAGHRYGPEHPSMAQKLTQINQVLTRVFEAVTDDTVVIVMGDHGMDPKGDHGGDSENELNAGLFVYSKGQLTFPDDTWTRLLLKLESLDFGTAEPMVSRHGQRTFPQIDITPTLALLSGIPIPFGNLGTLIPELFYVPGDGHSAIYNLGQAMRRNAHQVHAYIETYTARRSWASDSLSSLHQHFQSSEQTFDRALASQKESDWIDVVAAYTVYTRLALVSARKIWARFDVVLILEGVILLISTLIVLILFVISDANISGVGSLGFIGLVTAVGSGLGGSGWGIEWSTLGGEDSALQPHHQSLFLGVLGLLISVLLCVFSSVFNRVRKWPWKGVDRNVVLGCILLAMYVGSAGSDSFTVYEDGLSLHLLQTLGLVHLFWSLSFKSAQQRDGMIQKS